MVVKKCEIFNEFFEYLKQEAPIRFNRFHSSKYFVLCFSMDILYMHLLKIFKNNWSFFLYQTWYPYIYMYVYVLSK